MPLNVVKRYIMKKDMTSERKWQWLTYYYYWPHCVWRKDRGYWLFNEGRILLLQWYWMTINIEEWPGDNEKKDVLILMSVVEKDSIMKWNEDRLCGVLMYYYYCSDCLMWFIVDVYTMIIGQCDLLFYCYSHTRIEDLADRGPLVIWLTIDYSVIVIIDVTQYYCIEEW